MINRYILRNEELNLIVNALKEKSDDKTYKILYDFFILIQKETNNGVVIYSNSDPLEELKE